jgi:light-regulated signal transduction histidine kinase (bacteriophytochrome)
MRKSESALHYLGRVQATAKAQRIVSPEPAASPDVDFVKVNATLARENAELRRANAELEQFAWAVSHDLKEPLRMITNWLSLLDQRYREQLSDEGKEFLGLVLTGATRMRSLIDDLLGFAKLGTQPLAVERTNSEISVTAALANLHPAILESNAEIECSIMPDVLADPGLLTQVFQNLIGNAIKFRGIDVPRIRISAKHAGDHWTFSVSDNGIGIPVEFHDRVFNAFERLHSADEYPGNGIGLTIVRRIIERHGGRIWVESKDVGTTFLFSLPEAVEEMMAAGA